MKEGYPLFVYSRLSDKTYNQILVNEYLYTQQGRIQAYIENILNATMSQQIDTINKISQSVRE